MPSILIIDDDPQIRKLLRKIIEAAGYQALVASNGNEGLKIFKESRPDLLIIDIIMPEKEGLETIIELKRIDSAVKVIAISGGGKLKPNIYLPMAKKLGAAETISKPIDKTELLDKVKSVLSDT